MERVKELKECYKYICRRLQELVAIGEIDEYTRCSLVEMTMKVVNALAAKYENTAKEGWRCLVQVEAIAAETVR